jgi:hypothetical protein
MQYIITWFYTKKPNKYEADNVFTYITSDMYAAQFLWHNLHIDGGWPHVEVSDTTGHKKEPEKGCPNGY